mmetsp:Transcript_26311/g.53428  ORF Transcript_26311/g.53428 Transcript_26311/m.53428 type:complete len:93 (+) Transcript_26311:1067-1345(+)
MMHHYYMQSILGAASTFRHEQQQQQLQPERSISSLLIRRTLLRRWTITCFAEPSCTGMYYVCTRVWLDVYRMHELHVPYVIRLSFAPKPKGQ